MDDEHNAAGWKKTRSHGMSCLAIGITAWRRFLSLFAPLHDVG